MFHILKGILGLDEWTRRCICKRLLAPMLCLEELHAWAGNQVRLKDLSEISEERSDAWRSEPTIQEQCGRLPQPTQRSPFLNTPYTPPPGPASRAARAIPDRDGYVRLAGVACGSGLREQNTLLRTHLSPPWIHCIEQWSHACDLINAHVCLLAQRLLHELQKIGVTFVCRNLSAHGRAGNASPTPAFRCQLLAPKTTGQLIQPVLKQGRQQLDRKGRLAHDKRILAGSKPVAQCVLRCLVQAAFVLEAARDFKDVLRIHCPTQRSQQDRNSEAHVCCSLLLFEWLAKPKWLR